MLPSSRRIHRQHNSLIVLQLSGATGSATGGDGLGNLYARFSGDESKSKPMVIAETASEYLPDVKDGASELDIKTAWWKQVSNCT